MEQEDISNGYEEQEGDQDDGEDFGEMLEVVCSDVEGSEGSDMESEGEVATDEDSITITPLRDDATRTFSQHSDPVFSVCVDGSGSLACSGGKDDQGLVWKIDDGSIVFQCQGHKDSVTCTSFSHDSKYVVTADMAGLIQVWACPAGTLVWSFEMGDIEWLKWHPQAHVLLAGGSDGSGWMWRVPSGDCKTFQGDTRNTCSALANDGKHICCGYENGAVKMLDLKSGNSIFSLSSGGGGQGHSQAVTSMDVHHDNALLLTGSQDETAKLIHSNTGKVLSVFPAGFAEEREGGGEGEELSSGVEAVCFSFVLPVGLTASLSGVLGVWDLATQKLRQKCLHKSYGEGYRAGVVRVCSSAVSPVAFTGSLDGVVRGWDLRNGEIVKEWHGHSSNILDLSLLRDERAILSAAADNTVKIFTL